MKFNRWIDTFIAEKGIDTEERFEVEGPSGPNSIPVGCIVDAIKSAPPHEQRAIRDMLVKIDFHNAPVRPYLNHLAKALAQ